MVPRGGLNGFKPSLLLFPLVDGTNQIRDSSQKMCAGALVKLGLLISQQLALAEIKAFPLSNV